VKEEVGAVENGEAGTFVAVDRDGNADDGPEGICVETVTAGGVPQPVKIKTIKNTNREIDKFLMIIFSNEPDVLFTHLVELE